MIDCENEIYTKLYTNLKSQFQKITITSEPDLSPASFPCVGVYEADNTSYDKTKDSSGNENHAKVMYEINVFSNKKQGRKTECKDIFKVADSVLISLGFSRITKQPIVTDSIYRIVGRYTAVISQNKEIFRR